MSFNPDDYLDNADWTKGSGPADLSITNWPEAGRVPPLARDVPAGVRAAPDLLQESGEVAQDSPHAGPPVIVRHSRREEPPA